MYIFHLSKDYTCLKMMDCSSDNYEQNLFLGVYCTYEAIIKLRVC